MTKLRWLNSYLFSRQSGVCKGMECVSKRIDCVCPSARGFKTDIQTVILFTTPSPFSESLYMVMEDISCHFPLMKLIIYAEESKFLEETRDMTVALIRHVLLLLIKYFPSLHIKHSNIFFHLVFFPLSITVRLFCLSFSSCSLAHYGLWVGWTCSTSGILPLQISLIIPY